MRQNLTWLSLCLAFMLGSTAFSQDCRCRVCDGSAGRKGPKWDQYWTGLRDGIRSRADNLGPANGLLGAGQVVFLDFDSGDNGSIDYTTKRRDEIQVEMETIYDGFDVSLTQSIPSGQFSTIVFNEGGFAGGNAEDIDFRNLNPGDNAVLNVEGLGLLDSQIVTASANIAAHELGHLLGLRHHDTFGPIGNGVLGGFGAAYNPVYFGPQNAIESSDHVMATGGIGADFATILTPNWFSERSSVKIAFAEMGLATDDTEPNNTTANAQPLSLRSLRVHNTIVAGENMDVGDFSVSAAVVVGSLNGLADGQDIFWFSGKADDLLNMEVISNNVNRLSIDPIDPNVSIFDSAETFVDYYGVDAFNESEFETPLDSIIVDLILADDGEFFVRIDSSMVFESGNYELFIYRFNGILGDVNCDGAVDLLDVAPFVQLISSSEFDAKADINSDNVVDLLDVSPFVDLLTGF